MNEQEFKRRTKAFALRIIKLANSLPWQSSGGVLAKQLLRSGTSLAANYRAACRAKSRADFISKMGIVEEECDESLYWMEILVDSGKVRAARVVNLMKEANKLLSMVVSSINTSRARVNEPGPRKRSQPIRNLQSAI